LSLLPALDGDVVDRRLHVPTGRLVDRVVESLGQFGRVGSRRDADRDDDTPWLLEDGGVALLDLDAEQQATADAIEELNIKTPGPDALVHGLSGGNQQKVVIARWLAQDTPVLVMDNVTRGIDVGAKEEVYRLCRELTDKGVSIVFIGDELTEVTGMSNRIAVMNDGQFADKMFDASAGNKPTEEDLIQEMI